ALYRTAMRLTRNADDAEDLVQEACLRAYAQLPSLARADHPAAWLQRVQYRIFIDDVRHRRRSPFATLREPVDLLDVTPSEQPNPEERADGALIERHLEHAWRLRGKEQRALLALHAAAIRPGDAPAGEVEHPNRWAARAALVAASVAIAFGLAVWLGSEPAVEPEVPRLSPAQGGSAAARLGEPGAP